MSLRDRFFTPRVARAITSASAILSFGIGAALGFLATGNPLVAVATGFAAFAVRVALAIPRSERAAKQDPYGLKEPWVRHMNHVVAAERDYRAAVKRTPAGPLRDRMEAVGERVSESVAQAWEVARGGNDLAAARARIDQRRIANEFNQVQQSRAQADSPTLGATAAALQSQLDTAARMDAQLSDTEQRLRLWVERLEELVVRSIELSVSRTSPDALGSVEGSVDDIVAEMEALRSAVAEVRSPEVDATVPLDEVLPEAQTLPAAGPLAPTTLPVAEPRATPQSEQ